MKNLLDFFGIKVKEPRAAEVEIVNAATFMEVVRDQKKTPPAAAFSELEAKKIQRECQEHKW